MFKKMWRGIKKAAKATVKAVQHVQNKIVNATLKPAFHWLEKHDPYLTPLVKKGLVAMNTFVQKNAKWMVPVLIVIGVLGFFTPLGELTGFTYINILTRANTLGNLLCVTCTAVPNPPTAAPMPTFTLTSAATSTPSETPTSTPTATIATTSTMTSTPTSTPTSTVTVPFVESSTPVPTLGGTCGDRECNPGENSDNCPADCPAPPTVGSGETGGGGGNSGGGTSGGGTSGGGTGSACSDCPTYTPSK
jgi:uncharacterized membrane protein YgcG